MAGGRTCRAGASVAALYGRPAWFEAYRFLLSLVARLALAAFFGLLARLLIALGVLLPGTGLPS